MLKLLSEQVLVAHNNISVYSNMFSVEQVNWDHGNLLGTYSALGSTLFFLLQHVICLLIDFVLQLVYFSS